MARNIYVLDTCVLVHDPNAIFKFAEHDVYIPLTVIDELDRFKEEQGRRGWSAREFFRIYDSLDTDAMHDPKKGSKLGEKGGKLFIFNTELRFKKEASAGLGDSKADNLIIRSAQQIKEDNDKRKVVLVTKDRGLLIRARGWEVPAENYRSDLVQEVAYTGMREVEIDNNEDWTILWKSKEFVDTDKLSKGVQAQLADLNPHEAVLFCWGDEDKFPSLHKGNGRLQALGGLKMEFMGVKPKNLEQRIAMSLLADTSIPQVVLNGKAGTGKTISALAVALHQVANEDFDKIIFIKPVTPVGGKDIGFLPGSKTEKLLAWLGPLSDNIDQISGRSSLTGERPVEKMLEDGTIDAEAMTYIQGRSIARAIIIVDEAQNIKPREARMVAERCGPGSRVIFLGDLSQIEDPYLDKRSCGLAHAIEGGKTHPLSASVTLSDVVRSPLAAAASEIFSRPEAQR